MYVPAVYTVTTLDKIAPGEAGFNVYVKVLKAEAGKVGIAGRNVIFCTLADNTAQARASFVEPPADILKEGSVIAIRNGKAQVIKEQI